MRKRIRKGVRERSTEARNIRKESLRKEVNGKAGMERREKGNKGRNKQRQNRIGNLGRKESQT